MNYNKNSGWGQSLAAGLPFRGSGKLFFVGDSSTANIDMLKQIFDVDPDGDVRFHATIDSAVGECTANAGDLIVVAAGHSETISGATSIVLDVAGVSIVGLGEGTDRPTLTFSAAASSIPVSVANVTLKNLLFVASFADIVAAITLTTAKNFKLLDCEFKASAANVNFLALIETNATANAADGLHVEGCSWVEPDAATTSMINVDADLDKMVVKGCYLNLGVNASDLPAIAEVASGKDITNCQILDNVVIRLNDANPLLVTADTTTANTGVIANNFVRHLDIAGELLVTAGTNIGFFDNKASAAVDASGYLLPAADS